MIVIGEKINSTLKVIKHLIESNNSVEIQEIAKKQYEAGASYIDINARTFSDNEPEKLEWIISTIQNVIDIPFSIATTNPKALEKALNANQNGQPIVNSITDEKDRYDSLLPLAVKYKTGVIALCMDESGMPETVDESIKIAHRLVRKLSDSGIPMKDIYLDPMVRAIGSGSQHGIMALESISKLKKEFPGAHITCGISNISFGIPARKLMNQAFLVAALSAGLDSGILDPLDKKLMSSLYAAEALLGIDDFCMEYQMKFREGLLDT
ncbi:MAG: dihydropteroate synthase [Clostridia bacterium]|nr:dihydropteroate synthase [Clostridia bacterium]